MQRAAAQQQQQYGTYSKPGVKPRVHFYAPDTHGRTHFFGMDFLTAHQCLGRPIPCDEHAVSVSIPTYQDVVGYETGCPIVKAALKIGYPRFKIHFLVETLMNYMARPRARRSFTRDGDCDLGGRDDEGDDDDEDLAVLDDGCYVFPTLDVAKRFQKFLQSGSAAMTSSEISIQSCHYEGVTAVYFPSYQAASAKAYWQHTGEIVSSRLARDVLRSFGGEWAAEGHGQGQACLSVTPSHCGGRRLCASDELLRGVDIQGGPECDAARRGVEHRILGILGEPRLPHCIHLTVSGMAAIFSALRLVKAVAERDGLDSQDSRETSVVIFGFSYLDTLKMMDRGEFNKGGLHLFGRGDAADMEALQALLAGQDAAPTRVAAVFTEYPSNPLLNTPDLVELTRLAAQHNFLLVVDDTIGSFANVDLLHPPASSVRADILCSSLTKGFSGRGDVLAGSMVINSQGRRAQQLRNQCPSLTFAPLYGPDAVVLEANSRDYEVRCVRTSRTAWRLAQWLQRCPAIDQVYYPGINVPENGARFDSLCRHTRGGANEAGRGCLLSLVLASDTDTATSEAQKDKQMEVFFDAMSCWKGPSLGTNFTLSCPYTLLAHYGELQWAKQYGIDRRLVRVSVGLEEPEALEAMFTVCLAAAANAGRWTALHHSFVRHKGLPLPAFVRIFSFAY